MKSSVFLHSQRIALALAATGLSVSAVLGMQAFGLRDVVKIAETDRFTSEGLGGYASLAFSGDGKTIAAGTILGAAEIHLWDVTKKKKTKTLEGDPTHCQDIAFAQDGSFVAYSGTDPPRTIHVVSASSGKKIVSFPGQWPLRISGSGKVISYILYRDRRHAAIL